MVEIKVAKQFERESVALFWLDKLGKRVGLEVLVDPVRRTLKFQRHALVPKLGPYPLYVTSEDEIELLMDVEIAVIHPKVVPTMLR